MTLLYTYVSMVKTAPFYHGMWQAVREFILFLYRLVIFYQTQGRCPLNYFVAVLLLSALSFHSPLFDGQKQ